MWSSGLLRPPPMLREVHFWCVFPEEVQGAALLKVYESLLSQDEKKNLSDYHLESVRKERLITRALVRTTLARYGDGSVAPNSLSFIKNKFGKPKVVLPKGVSKTALPELQFNVSHTGSLIACGVTLGSLVGIDVEEKKRTPRADIMHLAKRKFSLKEVTWLESFVDVEERHRHFLQLWTLKEAYVKAVGKGMSGNSMKEFTFEFTKSPKLSDMVKKAYQLSPHPEALGIFPESSKEWQFLLFEPTPEHNASICVEHKDGDATTVFKFWKSIPLVCDELLPKGLTTLGWSA